MNKIEKYLFSKPIKITQATIQYGLQPWLETIMLIADPELKRLNDWSVGYYHCKQCRTYQGYAYKINDDNTQNKQAHNEQLEFMLAHAHGDGRIMMFDRRME